MVIVSKPRLDYNARATRTDYFVIENQFGRTLRVNITQHLFAHLII